MIKTLSLFALTILTALGLQAAATVTGNITDIGGTAGVSRLTIYPMSQPYFDGTNFVKYSVKVLATDTNGAFSTTLSRGDYRIVMDGTNRVNIAVPAGAGPFDISDIEISPLTYPWQTPPGFADITDVSVVGATQDQSLYYDATSGKWKAKTLPGTGSVTSVGLSVPSWLAVSNSPVTGSGTITVSAATNQTANRFVATPNGAAGQVSLRAIVSADIPSAYTASVEQFAEDYTDQTAQSLNTLISARVAKSGDTMTGYLTLSGAPTNTLHAATKAYVDAATTGLGTGSVTSVAQTVPAEFSIAGSPVTTTGTLAISKATQTANKVWAGPTSGGAAQPAFRSLVSADIPSLSYVTSVGLSAPSWLTVGSSPITSSGTISLTAATGQTANRVLATPDGSSGALSIRALTATDIPALAYATSVGITVPSWLTVSGSPVTSSGTLALTATSQSANTVLAGPSSGGAAASAFRALVLGDFPTGTEGYFLGISGGVPAYLPIAGVAGETNYYDTTIITNNYFVSGKGNTLIVTNALTPLQVGTNKLVSSAANGALTNAIVGIGLTLSGNTLSRDAITGDVTTSGDAATIATNAVTDAKFRQGAARSVVGVTGNATANTADIQGTTDQVLRVNGAGTALGFGAIDLSKTSAASGVLQAASYPATTGDVTSSAGSVATTIANDAVTYAKMQNVSATQRIIGRNTAGSGDPEEVTATQALDWLGSTRGQILYRGASAWTALAAGTSGYLLTAAGAGADPSWAVAPAGGLVTSASQFAIVGGSASGTANGTALLAAYVVAQTATPQGNALAANNRYTILLLPGVYDLGSSTLTMDTAFVDIVGMGDPAWQSTAAFSSTDNGNTVITSSSGTATVTVSASSSQDVLIARMALVNSSSGKAFNPNADANNNTKLIWVLIVNTGSTNNDGMTQNRSFNGLYVDCISRNYDSFGTGSGDAGGKFYRCKARANSFGGSVSGGTGTASGQFWDCESDGDSFGKQTSSGKFFRCRMVTINTGGDVFGHASGGTASGTYIECQGGDGTASFAGNGGTMSGVMIGCFPSTGAATTLAQASVTGEIRNCPLYTGWNGCYAMNTADSTQVSNTASESNFSTTKTIAASAWKTGRAFKWEAWGKYSCTNATPGTITFKTKFGSTAANTSDALALPAAGASALGWNAQGIFVCRTIGGSGTVSSQSKWEMDQGTLGVLNESLKPSNGTTTIANNGSLTFQISVTFSSASASNAATLENFLLTPLEAN